MAIIGAGFSGVIAALTLKERGDDDFLIFERAQRVGGVWRDNAFPGCACDIRSNLYSMTRRPNPDWTSNYAHRAEIMRYIEDIVDQEGLSRHIRFGSLVTELCFDRALRRWIIAVGGQEALHARAVLIATGPQNRPKFPDLNGIDRFTGSWWHSAAWDSAASLRGRRVVVVGSGASAVQIVPNIAGDAAAVTMIQRSAPWILPRGEHKVSSFMRAFYRRFPRLQRLDRGRIYWLMELVGLGNLGHRSIARVLDWIARRKLRREVRDPLTRTALTPDYPLGCKRVMVSDDFLPAFNLPHVNVETTPIRGYREHGVELTDGRLVEADHIVFATGFNVADADGYLSVKGLPGHNLPDDWLRDGATAYLGTVATGFPNLAFMLGPNSGLSHSSVLYVVEAQMRYIVAWLEEIRRAGALDVRPEVQERYNTELQALFAGTVWSSGCRSWYLNRNRRNTAIFPGTSGALLRRLRFDRADFRTVDP
jgi:cation diffusion facilitator CzcD-associated flavoprotein CzcO